VIHTTVQLLQTLPPCDYAVLTNKLFSLDDYRSQSRRHIDLFSFLEVTTMFAQKFVMGLAVPALLLAASAAQARGNAAADQCVFEKYAVSSVAPFRVEENFGYGTYTKLRGAQLFVPAREGLTAEWLQLSVQQSLAKQTGVNGSPSCEPAVPAVQVHVISGGPGFWVQLAAADERSAEALLKWAKTIVPAQHATPSVR
jgi:hypothetical protein